MGVNVTRRVSYRGGFIGLFSGESQGKALDRELRRLNTDGYRLVFIVTASGASLLASGGR